MDKSCRLNGNFHSDDHTVKCVTPGLYRSLCQGKDDKTINIEIRYVVAQDVRMGDIGWPCTALADIKWAVDRSGTL